MVLEDMRRDLLPARVVSFREYIEQSITVSRLIVETQSTLYEYIQAVVLFQPMRKHVHPCNGTTRGPNISIDDPLLIPRPFHLWVFVLHPHIFNIVDCGFFAIENTSRSSDRCAGAVGKQQFPGGDMTTSEVSKLRVKFEVCWVGPGNQEAV